MTDLNTLASLAQIAGNFTVVGGMVFAFAQFREYRRQRQETAAAELMRSFYHPDFARAISTVKTLPDGVSSAALRGMGAEHEQAAILVCATYETMGVLVFHEMTSFVIVQELTGGLAVVMWRKLYRWCEELRVEQAQPSWAEWFQWLAERLQQAGQEKESQPAYRKYAGWKPR